MSVMVLLVIILGVIAIIEGSMILNQNRMGFLLIIVGILAIGWGVYDWNRSDKHDPNKYKFEIANIVQTSVKKNGTDNTKNMDHLRISDESSYEIREKTADMLMQRMDLKKKDVDVKVSDAGSGDPTLNYNEYEKTKGTPYCKMEITIRGYSGDKTCTMYIPLT